MRRSQRRRGRRQSIFPEISLTPLIDTALTLLIIFMVTTPMLKNENALQVELPKGSMKEVHDSKEEEFVITLDKNGKMALNSTVMKKLSIIDKLKSVIAQNKKQTVFVKADAAVDYGKVIELIDSIKYISGVQYVALATTKNS